MNKFKQLLIVIAFFSLLILCGCRPTDELTIRTAVERQISQYPASTLQDLYKSFFQDNFGPGHIVSDTASAGRYLDRELATSNHLQETNYEPTGYQGNFYRVSLSLIHKGYITRDAYFAAFIHSVAQVNPPTALQWRREWGRIAHVIEKMNLHLPHYEQDKARIDSLLQQNGDFALHHSEAYNQAYDPHYRIIARSVFEKEILPHVPSE